MPPDRPRSRPFDEAEQDQLRALHADGLSAHAIAGQLGRSQATISRWARKLDLGFDRARTQQATQARVVDAAGRRAALCGDALEEIGRLVGRLRGPGTVVLRTGDTVTLPKVTAAEARDLASAVASLSMSVARLTGIPEPDAADQARSMLGDLMTNLTRWAGTHPEEGTS